MITTLTRKRSVGLLWCALWATTACIETGAEPVALPLFVSGTEVEGAFAGRDGVQIELSSARLAFGPLTLCAGATAASLCETAHAEWYGSAIVDALDPSPKRVGEVVGIGGPVHSWMYELGFVSLLTQEQPLPTSAALKLGHSVHLEGTARRATEEVDGSASPQFELHFVAEIDVRQEVETERGVPVVSKSTSERFEHDLSEPELQLLVRFDPRPWFEQVDFVAAASQLECTPECALQIDEDSQAYRALQLALVAGEHPTFVFGTHLAKR